MIPGYRFGSFELRTVERTLLADGHPVVLGARALDVLLALLAHDRQLVSKDELLQCAWPGLVVEEANVHVQISLLRKALGTQAIATVAGLGYRFAMPVELVSAAALHNLPTARTAFIGRASALVEAEARLHATRVLSFIGIGGSGKTRLAIALAERVLPQFPHGVWLLDLAALEDAAQVPAALARVLGVAQTRDTPLEHALIAKLRGHYTLVVFDNCEHLLDAVAALIDVLLEGAPPLKIICTSRDALGLPGESTFAVRPLELPVAGAMDATVAASESVQLFIDRARTVAPGIEFDPQTLPVVAEICRRLDGIPLAIELAAARMKMLSVTQVQSMLDERFRLLTGGTRALARQQTLQAVIQWSYEHLAVAEQRLLRALSVCGGGCDLGTAVTLLGDSGARDEMSALDSLTLLVDKSLLTVERQGQSARYVMLETVRQYAIERLDQSGETARVRDRHRDYFLALAEAMAREWTGDQSASWITRLDRDRDNLFRALTWCAGAADAQYGLRMVSALCNYWPSRGLLVRGYEATTQALARATTQQHDRWRCSALFAATDLSCLLGDGESTRRNADALLSLSGAIGDLSGLSRAHWHIGKLHFEHGDVAAARLHHEQSLTLARRTGDEREVVNALGGLAFLAEYSEMYDQAEALWQEVLTLCSRTQHRFAEAVAVLNLATIAINRRLPLLARERLLNALERVRHTGSRLLGQNLIDAVAALAAMTDDGTLAVKLYAASKRQRSAIDMPPNSLDAGQIRDLDRAREALGATGCASAEQAGFAMDYEQTMAEIGVWLHGE